MKVSPGTLDFEAGFLSMPNVSEDPLQSPGPQKGNFRCAVRAPVATGTQDAALDCLKVDAPYEAVDLDVHDVQSRGNQNLLAFRQSQRSR